MTTKEERRIIHAWHDECRELMRKHEQEEEKEKREQEKKKWEVSEEDASS